MRPALDAVKKLRTACCFLLLFLLFAAPTPSAGAAAQSDGRTLETAIFAGGCFWCMEPPFDKLDGVVSTTAGYTGGRTKNPTYGEVSAGGTGHAEAIRIVYDPARVSYSRLLEVFWHNIDPTTPHRQFCDVGDQYRAAIFYASKAERILAEKSKQADRKSRPHPGTNRNRDCTGRVILPCRGVPPELLPEKPAALQILPAELRTGSTPQGSLGRFRGPVTRGETYASGSSGSGKGRI